MRGESDLGSSCCGGLVTSSHGRAIPTARWITAWGFARTVALAMCSLVAFAISVGGAYASGPKLQLISNAKPVPKGQPSAVITKAAFPGFTCEGFSGAMPFQGGLVQTLRFIFAAEGGGEAFSSCQTGTGEEVSTATEGPAAKLARVAITSEAVTETFKPAPIFDDEETGCVWELHTLRGVTPSSGPLQAVPVAGHLRLLSLLSARTCARSGEAAGTVTIEAAPEGAPPGSYEVERIP